MATARQRAADLRYARAAKRTYRHMTGSLRCLWEARSAGIHPSLALAIRQQESGVIGDGNVFGHDPTIFVGAGKVTKSRYLQYRQRRGTHGQGGMQGVGPLQLTYYTFQDEADRLGGCWKAKCCYRVGMRHLKHLVDMYDGDVRRALGVYNGGAGNPNYAYADSVLAFERAWHHRLT